MLDEFRHRCMNGLRRVQDVLAGPVRWVGQRLSDMDLMELGQGAGSAIQAGMDALSHSDSGGGGGGDSGSGDSGGSGE